MNVVVKTNPLKGNAKKTVSYSKTLSLIVFITVAIVFFGMAAAMYIGYAYTKEITLLLCAILFTALSIAFPILIFKVLMPYILRKQNEMYDLAYVSVEYSFSDESLTCTKTGGKTEDKTIELSYLSLLKVTETPVAFILFTNDGEMKVPKADIIVGDADELSSKLKAVLRNEYYKV